MTARVFVPLVGANGTAEQMFEAIAGDTAPEPHPAKLLPQISELFDFGLYRIGQTVREAVARFVESRRRRVWLGRRNARVAPWYLRISDLQIGRLSDDNARSAGLGLALAALLQAFERDAGPVFATGEILFPATPGAAPIAIGPVDGIRGKLMLVGDYLSQHRASLADTRMVLALPSRTVDGRSMAEAEASILARLKAEAEEAGGTLDVVFLDTLDGLEQAFGRFELAEILTPRRALAGGAVLAAAAALVAGWFALAHAPVVLAWAPAEVGKAGTDASDSAQPRRARYDAATDKLVVLPPCYDSQRQPVVIGGETLLMRITAADGLPYASRLRPPRIFVASVSRAADPVILDAALFQRPTAADAAQTPFDAVTAIPIEPMEDEVRLFVVATRDPTIQATALIADLRQRLEGLSGAAILTTTASFLKDRMDAEIDYQFKVTRDARLCPT